MAWRAGIAFLLADGFDEMGSQVVANAGNGGFMREARHQALRGIRELLQKLPSKVGVLLCGRDNYFDDIKELELALGLNGKEFRLFRLGEFTEQQAERFLRKHDAVGALPDWLPRKPLILGYLAHRGLLAKILEIDSTHGFGHAWDQFLTLICEREAEYEHVVMEPETLRRVLERLACSARSTVSGTGPVTGRELADAYRVETGQVAGEGVLMQLQRLPGLTQRDQDPMARSFIDEDMLSALQGSAVSRLILESQDSPQDGGWLSGMSNNGVAMACHVLQQAATDLAVVITAAVSYGRGEAGRRHNGQLAADCVSIAIGMARMDGKEAIDFRDLTINGGSFHALDMEELTVNGLQLEDCAIEEVCLSAHSVGGTLRFVDCMIGRVRGISSSESLPPTMFVRCSVREYDDLSTNSAIVRSDLEPPVKALFTILRKLYIQAGGGRKQGALRRGLPTGRVLDSVDGVLRVLESEGLVKLFGGIAHPVRRQSSRVRQLLSTGLLSNDPIMVRVREL